MGDSIVHFTLLGTPWSAIIFICFIADDPGSERSLLGAELFFLTQAAVGMTVEPKPIDTRVTVTWGFG